MNNLTQINQELSEEIESASKLNQGFQGLTNEELKELTVRSDFKAIVLTLGQFCLYLICLVGAILDYSIIGNIVAGIGAGFAITLIFIIGHDACHQALAKSSILNKFIGRFCFGLSLHSYSLWYHIHNLHHSYTNIKGLDTGFVPHTKEEYQAFSKSKKFLEKFLRSSLGTGTLYILDVWLSKIFLPTHHLVVKQWEKYILDSLIVLFIAALNIFAVLSLGHFLTTKPDILLIFLGYLFPLFMALQFIGITTYCQHTHPQIPWFVKDEVISFIEREVLTTPHIHVHQSLDNSIFFSPLPDVMNHAAHHLYSRIPLYNLKKAQQLLEEKSPGKILQDNWTIAKYIETTRICKLYDFDRNCWTDFDGNPTAPPIPRLGDDKMVELLTELNG